MDEKLYRELGQLTKDKTIWKQNIPYVASLLKNQSPKITAKAMWLLAMFSAGNRTIYKRNCFFYRFGK